jgi:hypothetical protein
MNESPDPKSLQQVSSPSGDKLEALPTEIENLPAEMRTMVSVIAGFFRSTSGPDPETAKIMAQAEMHEESCKLEAYSQSLKNRDQQNERDHVFRVKRMNHETAKSLVVMVVCLGGIMCGLYLIVAKKDSAVGTPLLVAGFMALLGGKSILPKDKD